MASISDEEIHIRINALSATRFENLTLDLVRAVGFRNVVWRTPGADGGRDIQAEQTFSDLTNSDVKHKWYIECKHYATSIDWATLWKKIAFADVQGADYLLLATNSQPSPQCETEIERWNAERRRPGIRIWRGYDLPMYMRIHQEVAFAHGIFDFTNEISSPGVEIALTLSKLVQSAYGAWCFEGKSEFPLTAASALSELLNKRMDDLQTYGFFSKGDPMISASDWPWLSLNGDPSGAEEVGFRAIVSIIRHLLQAEVVECHFAEDQIQVHSSCAGLKFDEQAYKFLEPVLLLARCDAFEAKSDSFFSFQLRG